MEIIFYAGWSQMKNSNGSKGRVIELRHKDASFLSEGKQERESERQRRNDLLCKAEAVEVRITHSPGDVLRD